MSSLDSILIFSLDAIRYALRLSSVHRVVRVAEVTLLPNAPEIVQGALNVQGEVIPVINIRSRFRLPAREVNLTDHLIIARTSRRNLALSVDSVAGVAECPEAEAIAADRICPNLEYVEGVVKLDDGLILIHNLDTFLSLEEEQATTEALKQ